MMEADMTHRQATLTQLQQALRCNVCPSCPFRQRPIEGEGLRRPCEADCPLFVNLPALAKRAGRLDPMVGRHEDVLCDAMRRIIDQTDEARCRPLRRCHRQAAKVLARLLNS
jgi:hypothetical protein